MKKRKLFSFFIAIVISVVCSAEGIVSARSFSLIGGRLNSDGIWEFQYGSCYIIPCLRILPE